MRDLNDSETPIASSSPYNLGIENNIPLMAALGAFTVAQILKVFTYRLAERKWDFRRLVGSGGMPSSHASLVRGVGLGWDGNGDDTVGTIFLVSLSLLCSF